MVLTLAWERTLSFSDCSRARLPIIDSFGLHDNRIERCGRADWLTVNVSRKVHLGVSYRAECRPSRGSVMWIVHPALTYRAFLCRPFGAGVVALLTRSSHHCRRSIAARASSTLLLLVPATSSCSDRRWDLHN